MQSLKPQRLLESSGAMIPIGKWNRTCPKGPSKASSPLPKCYLGNLQQEPEVQASRNFASRKLVLPSLGLAGLGHAHWSLGTPVAVSPPPPWECLRRFSPRGGYKLSPEGRKPCSPGGAQQLTVWKRVPEGTAESSRLGHWPGPHVPSFLRPRANRLQGSCSPLRRALGPGTSAKVAVAPRAGLRERWCWCCGSGVPWAPSCLF